MSGGAFNISRLIRELGLKNAEIPVIESIQPTMPLASMAGQVPVHVGAVAMGGGYSAATAAEHSAYQIQVLDPGGLVIQWISALDITATFMVTVQPIPIPWLTRGPVALTVQQFNNGNPTLSQLDVGTAAAPVTTVPAFRREILACPFAPLFVPRGSYLWVVRETPNSAAWLSLCWCGITASEGGD